MSTLTRVCISLDAELLRQFDRLLARQGYPTRSEAIKALIRQALVQRQWQDGQAVAGAVALVYDHHHGAAVKKLIAVQHDFGPLIVSAQHVHLDHDHCLELIVAKGRAARLRQLLSRLKSVKGVKYSELVMAAAGAARA
jgi:CopG family nickel-responsive transcriptional regulator